MEENEAFKETITEKIIRVVSVFYSKFNKDSCFQMSSSLSFSTIISLVPIFTLALSILTNLTIFDSVQKWIKRFLFQFFIPSQAEIVQNYIEDFSRKINSLNAISIVSFLLTGVFLMITIENNLNKIWRVKNRSIFFVTIVTYWAVLTLGPVFLGASFYLTRQFIFLPARGTRSVLTPYFYLIFSYIMSSVLIFIMYHNMPNTRVKVKSALIGALFTGFFYEVLKNFFTSYINHLDYNKIYGSLAVIPIFFGWLYTIWIIFLIGAELTYFVQYPKKLNVSEEDENIFFIDEIEIFFFIIEKYVRNNKVNNHVLSNEFSYFDNFYIESIINDLTLQNLILFHEARGYIPYDEPATQNIHDILLKIMEVHRINPDQDGMIQNLITRLDKALNDEFKENILDFINNKDSNTET